MEAKVAYPDREVLRDSEQPLYLQLEDIIRDFIQDGKWRAGEAIPSERQLSVSYGLSRMTVRKALDRLVAAGLLYRVDGKGTFIGAPKISFKALSLAGLRRQMLDMGHTPSARLLGVERILTSETITRALHLPANAPVYRIERVMYANEVALALHCSYIPLEACPRLGEFDLAQESLYAVLKREYSIDINHATEILEATLATEREGLLLSVPPNSPLLLLRILMFDTSGRPIEYVKVIFRGDRVQLLLDV